MTLRYKARKIYPKARSKRSYQAQAFASDLVAEIYKAVGTREVHGLDEGYLEDVVDQYLSGLGMAETYTRLHRTTAIVNVMLDMSGSMNSKVGISRIGRREVCLRTGQMLHSALEIAHEDIGELVQHNTILFASGFSLVKEENKVASHSSYHNDWITVSKNDLFDMLVKDRTAEPLAEGYTDYGIGGGTDMDRPFRWLTDIYEPGITGHDVHILDLVVTDCGITNETRNLIEVMLQDRQARSRVETIFLQIDANEGLGYVPPSAVGYIVHPGKIRNVLIQCISEFFGRLA